MAWDGAPGSSPGTQIQVHVVYLGGDSRKHCQGPGETRQKVLSGSLQLWAAGARSQASESGRQGKTAMGHWVGKMGSARQSRPTGERCQAGSWKVGTVL